VHEAGRVVGYYGLAPTAVVPNVLPRSIRTGQPPDPVPCLLLGQLATDIAWAGRGIGTGLLKHALERVVTAALVGGRALMVNAVDAEAAAFRRRRGFIPSRDDPLVLFRSIADIAASLAEASGRDAGTQYSSAQVGGMEQQADGGRDKYSVTGTSGELLS
jgi:hypothetical protein